MKIEFFERPSKFREWLQKHHDKETELFVGFYKKDSGKPSITWPESVDEALCFGWIDGVRRSIDDKSYSIRFTPRRRQSNWSKVNIGRVEELTKSGRMQSAGLRAFEARVAEKSGVYSYEKDKHKLDADSQKKFQSNKKAWTFFQSQPPWYQRTSIYWVISAKKKETRLKRLSTLIEDSANGRAIGPLRRTKQEN